MPSDKLCLVVCRNFEREVNAVVRMEDWKDVIVRTYDPTCCRPDLTPVVLEQIEAIRQEAGHSMRLIDGCPITSIYARKSNLPQNPEGAPTLCTCFYRLAGHEWIDRHIQEGAYLLTPGWSNDWRARLDEWGFDQKTAREFFGEFSSCLVLLDTGTYENSTETVSDFADYIHLPFRIDRIGLDFFRLLLKDMVQSWRMETLRRDNQEAVRQANRKLADHAMAFDFLSGLSRMLSEMEVIQKILELFTMLFASRRIVYASVVDNLVTGTFSSSPPEADSAACQAWLEKGRREYAWEEDIQGFYLRLVNQGRTLGLLELSGIPFPQNRNEYLNLSPPLANMCALAVINARLVHEVRQLANTDPLTGLFNRRHFFDLAKPEFTTARRYRRPLAAFLLDIDFFKKVNDSFGHAVGDQTLIQVAQCCRRELRSADLCGRYGGEEFMCLLPETPPANAWLAAERLRRAIAAEEITREGHTIRVTASIGLAMLRDDCLDIDTLINRCDQALYAAKKGGRNRVCGERQPSGDIPVTATPQCGTEQKH